MRVVVVWLFLTGCGSLTLRPVNPDHAARKLEVTGKLGIDEVNLDQVIKEDKAACDALDNKVIGFTATAVTLGVLGGGSGLTSIFTENTPRYAIGGVGVGLAALTALFSYLSTQFASKYARQCAVNVGGR
jgi:hypothetical protein